MMAAITDPRVPAGFTVVGLMVTGTHTGKKALPANCINFGKRRINGTGTKIDGIKEKVNRTGIMIRAGTEAVTEMKIVTGTEIGIGTGIGING